jgi:alcohol dehydrogenase
MSLFEISSFSCPTKVHFGFDAYKRLPDIVATYGWKRLFLMIDPALLDGEFHRAIKALMEGTALALDIFSHIEPEPKDMTANAAFERCKAHKADAIIALGGGSTIDVAKAAAILMTNGGRIADYEGIEKFSIAPLPLIAIPSTAGTGSEVSGACVITDTNRNVKMAIRHAAFGPAQVAILDPLAVSTAPAHVAAHSGVDAFVHAFESYLSKKANAFSDAVNLHAMRLICGSIRQFVANRQNPTAALDMLCGSSMAALSFGTTGLGNVHCMAMSLGSHFPVPHGLANAVCLPTAAEFNFIANPERYAKVAEVMGLNITGMSQLDAGRAALRGLRDLCADLGVPSRLRDVGATEDKIESMAKQSFKSDYNRWNPRYTTEKEFVSLFQSAY